MILSIKERERIKFFPVLLLDLLNHRVNRAAISCARFLHCSFIAGVMLCFISIQQGIVSHFMDSANAARCFTAAPAQVKEPKYANVRFLISRVAIISVRASTAGNTLLE